MTFDKLANPQIVQNTKEALEDHKYTVTVAKNGEEALNAILELVPDGADISQGASVTLEQIGFVALLQSGEHKWKDWNSIVRAENDAEKRDQLRKDASMASYYLGSVHALTEDGDFVIASNTGSQLPHIVYNANNLIFVVSTKKIVPTLAEAMERLETYVVPLEDKHMQDLYKVHTEVNKIVIFKGESSFSERKIHFVLVEEDLGF